MTSKGAHFSVTAQNWLTAASCFLAEESFNFFLLNMQNGNYFRSTVTLQTLLLETPKIELVFQKKRAIGFNKFRLTSFRLSPNTIFPSLERWRTWDSNPSPSMEYWSAPMNSQPEKDRFEAHHTLSILKHHDRFRGCILVIDTLYSNGYSSNFMKPPKSGAFSQKEKLN